MNFPRGIRQWDVTDMIAATWPVMLMARDTVLICILQRSDLVTAFENNNGAS